MRNLEYICKTVQRDMHPKELAQQITEYLRIPFGVAVDVQEIAQAKKGYTHEKEGVTQSIRDGISVMEEIYGLTYEFMQSKGRYKELHLTALSRTSIGRRIDFFDGWDKNERKKVDASEIYVTEFRGSNKLIIKKNTRKE
jgi:hypothetical protein